MTIGLLLKPDMGIGLQPFFILEIQSNPFDAILDEERNIQQLPLLGRMNQFVVQFLCIKRSYRQHEAK